MESACGGSAVHDAALVGVFGIVVEQVSVEHGLYFLDGLEPGPVALDVEVFVQHGPVLAFDDAIGLWSADLGALVGDALQLQEQFIRMVIFATAELAAVVAEHGSAIHRSCTCRSAA